MSTEKLLKKFLLHGSCWGQRIITAELEKGFSDILKEKAGCVYDGPLDDIDIDIWELLKIDIIWGIKDRILAKQCDQFYLYVKDDDFINSARILIKIHKRVNTITQQPQFKPISNFIYDTSEWSVPHFADDLVECNCQSVLYSNFGAIATIHWNSDKSCEHGCHPLLPEAKGNAKIIAKANRMFELINKLAKLNTPLKAQAQELIDSIIE